MAARNGKDAVVELLLKDGRANPAAGDNAAIKMAKYVQEFQLIDRRSTIELLSKDPRVQQAAAASPLARWE